MQCGKRHPGELGVGACHFYCIECRVSTAVSSSIRPRKCQFSNKIAGGPGTFIGFVSRSNVPDQSRAASKQTIDSRLCGNYCGMAARSKQHVIGRSVSSTSDISRPWQGRDECGNSAIQQSQEEAEVGKRAFIL